MASCAERKNCGRRCTEKPTDTVIGMPIEWKREDYGRPKTGMICVLTTRRRRRPRHLEKEGGSLEPYARMTGRKRSVAARNRKTRPHSLKP